MKKIHIILLVFIAGAIALLISLLNTGSTYDTITEAKAKPGKYVHVAVRRDTTMSVEYDQLKDPNYLSFHAVAVDTSKEKRDHVCKPPTNDQIDKVESVNG